MGTTRRLLERVEVKGDERSVTADGNEDSLPLPPSRRTYGPWEFVTLWVITGSFNIGGWTTGSSLIALGLNAWQCMVTVIIGNLLVGVFCVLSGAPGAKWHIPFPVIQRGPWGVHGYRFVIIQRVFLACIWFSTQVYWGSQCVRTLLTAMSPSFRNLDTPLAGGTMTTGDFLSFVIFTIMCWPLMWIKPERYKVPFLINCALVIPTILALLIWCTAKAKGGGSFLKDVSVVTTQATGTRLGWMMVLGICTNISTISVHIYVQSDYTRYARKPKDQILAQLVMVPLGTIVVALIGIICTSCAAQLFPESEGTLLWEPYSLFSAIQLHYEDSPRSRAAVAFASIPFILAQFGQVIANNGVSAGNDLTALFPRFFNIRRSMYVMSALAFVVQPWQLLNGASKFLTVLGGYGVFLGPMTGIMFADYFIVRKRLYKLTHLYTPSSESIYWFWKGVNWRAFIAWPMGVWITLPGFAQQVRNPSVVLEGWTQMYYFSWPLGTLIAMGTYCSLCWLSPVEGIGMVDDEDVFGTFGDMDRGHGMVHGIETSVGSEGSSQLGSTEKDRGDVSVSV